MKAGSRVDKLDRLLAANPKTFTRVRQMFGMSEVWRVPRIGPRREIEGIWACVHSVLWTQDVRIRASS